MNTVSKKLSIAALAVAGFSLLCSCDFQGPWSYYPEESDVYLGVYTYGYIVAEDAPHVCFSKVYELTEASAEDFPFYDSASVTVSGKFASGEATAKLSPRNSDGKPNCFSADAADYAGVAGETYQLKAFFKWDSAGKKVKTEYKAETTIPQKLHAKGFVPPSMMGDAEFVENDYKSHSFEHLGFPMDIKPYKVAMEYDESVRGLLTTLVYDNINGGESMDNTINAMMGSMVKPDSMGYTGLSLVAAEYNTTKLGFTARMNLNGKSTLDTFEFTGMTTPIGKLMLRFYATDQAYSDYQSTVLQALEDSRVVPKSNVENGMGVFSGMLKDSLYLEVTDSAAIPFSYIRMKDCEDMTEDPDSTWNTPACRAFGDQLCIDTLDTDDGVEYDVKSDHGFCRPIAVKFAMQLDTNKWSLFLPDTLSKEKKDEAYADGLKRYCVSSNFENNSLAKCDQIYEDCQVSPEKNYCKKYLWQWCSDRDWNYKDYPQCGTGLVSRYYIEELKSSILERVVDSWCKENPKDKQCR